MARRRAVSLTIALVCVAGPVACGGGDDASTADASEAGSGCGTGEPISGRPIRLATTVAPITNIVANVAGDSGAEITGVVPEGTNSHTYEPPPSVAATLEHADVVFVNGLQLEEPTRALAAANLQEGSEICELGTTVLDVEDYAYDFSFPEDGGRPNPHLWTNPPMALDYAELTRDVLVARDPVNADRYTANFEAFAERVNALDAALRAGTETIPEDERLLVTYHDAYAYFAREYGWTVVGAMQPASFDQPTPREVADLIELVRERGVRAIFGSEVFPSAVLDQIASEAGAEYVDDLRDDDLPGAPGDRDHSWLALMQFNYVTIIEALGGDASEVAALDVGDAADDRAEYPQ